MTDESKDIEFPAKGKIVPLLYSQDARQRIVAGIRWNAREQVLQKGAKPVSVTTGSFGGQEEDYDNPYTSSVEANVNLVTQTYDMDLICLIYDSGGVLIDAVSPDPAESIDRSGKIYHSGDETRGVRGSDDETISVELKDLPEDICHIVFLAICQSGHSFDQIVAPEGRISDGKTDTDLLLVPMGGAAAKGKTACIFARIFRGEGGWMLHHIGEFRVDRQVADWGAEAAPCLSSKG